MILCFSVLCVLHAKDSKVCDTKIRRPQKNSWKFVRPQKIAEILQNPPVDPRQQ